MSKERFMEVELFDMGEIELQLVTLCLEGTAIAICALGRAALERDRDAEIRSAFFETWAFGGGDLRQLANRMIMARAPTRKERKTWLTTATATGKPYCVLGGGGEARGVA
jgi:hypothetical protein